MLRRPLTQHPNVTFVILRSVSDSATLSGFSILEQQENSILLQLDPVPIIDDFVAEDVCWAASGKPDGHVRGRRNDVVVIYITFPDEYLVQAACVCCILEPCAVAYVCVIERCVQISEFVMLASRTIQTIHSICFVFFICL